MNIIHRYTLTFCMLTLAACEEAEPVAVGQLMSDRVEIVVEFAERINRIEVEEGEWVEAGQVLLVQDNARVTARLQEAEAAVLNQEAVLDEQLEGPRSEVIEAEQANLTLAEVESALAEKEWERAQSLLPADLISQEEADLARARLDSARATVEYRQARLRELEAGTRSQQLEQTRHLLAQALARVQLIQLDAQRLTREAPVAGIVDSLPFEVGEQPPVGSVIAILLADNQPHARVYVPESIRVNIRPGDSALVYVDGLDQPLQGTLTWVASEAAFTPYFALTGNDRGRLSYLAEITLPLSEPRLPDGIPVQAFFDTAEER